MLSSKYFLVSVVMVVSLAEFALWDKRQVMDKSEHTDFSVGISLEVLIGLISILIYYR